VTTPNKRDKLYVKIRKILDSYSKRIDSTPVPPFLESDENVKSNSHPPRIFGKEPDLSITQAKNSFKRLQDEIANELAKISSGPLNNEEKKLADDISQTAANYEKRAETSPIHLLSESSAAMHYRNGTQSEKTAHPTFKRKVIGAMLILIAGAVFFLFMQNRISREKIFKTYPLPYTEAAHLTLKDSLLFSIDTRRQLVFTISAENGDIQDIKKFPIPDVRGLAAGNNCLWSADGRFIYRHKADSGFEIQQTFSSPGGAPNAIYWDGEFLWVADFRSHAISQYATGDSLNLRKRYVLAGILPTGIYVSQEPLVWILNPDDNQILRYECRHAFQKRDFLDLNQYLPPGAIITGFTVKNPHLWIILANPAKLLRFELECLRFRESAGQDLSQTEKI